MKRILLLFTILFVSVITSACINNIAIQELNNKAESYMTKGDTESAICRLKSSLELDNEVYQTHYNLAVAYNNIKKYDEAVKELEKVLELKPDLAEAYYVIATAKESSAYQVIESENNAEPTLEQIEIFNTKAADAVEAYNQYLFKKPNATETKQINETIDTLNKKIKEYTQVYDAKKAATEKQIQNELQPKEEASEEANQ